MQTRLMAVPMILAAALTLARPAAAQKPSDAASLESLQGLREVAVVVEGLQDDAIAAGLTVEQIEADVRAVLANAGLRVVDAAEGARAGMPFVYVVLATSTEKSGGDPVTSASITVELKQRVCLERSRATCLFASTWSHSRMGLGHSMGPEDFLPQIGNLAGRFARDYRAANASATR